MAKKSKKDSKPEEKRADVKTEAPKTLDDKQKIAFYSNECLIALPRVVGRYLEAEDGILFGANIMLGVARDIQNRVEGNTHREKLQNALKIIMQTAETGLPEEGEYTAPADEEITEE